MSDATPNWPEPRKAIEEGDWPPTLRPLIQDYVDHLYILSDEDDDRKRNESTVDGYLKDFRWFERYLSLNDSTIYDISPRDAVKIGKHLGQKYSGSQAGIRVRNISNLYNYLHKMEDIEDDPWERWDLREDMGINEQSAEQTVHLEDGERYGPTVEEIRLLQENAGEEHRLRNQAVLQGFFDTGCRVGEFSQIKTENIDEDAREIFLPGEITKYNIPRTVAYGDRTAALLNAWLYDGFRRKEAQAPDSDYLWPTAQSEHISTTTLGRIVRDAATRAGLNRDLWKDANGRWRAKLTPHNIRYSTGYYMLFDENDEPRENANIYKVSKYLGHSQVSVTERIYIERNPRAGVDAGHELMPDNSW